MPLPASIPELAALDLFVTVVESGSVSRASAEHGISQPSGSARISRLERRLGLSLLRRTPAGSVPTEAGLVVAEWARSVLEAATRFNGAVDALRAETGGRLRLAASYTIAEYLLPGWLSVLAPQLPATAVELNVGNSVVVTSRVLAGAADLGFIEGATVHEGLESRTVGHDELVVVVHSDHGWARRRQPLTVHHLAAARLVVREQGSGTREVLEKLLEPHLPDPRPTPLIELGSTTAVKAAVLDGVGPAVLSRLAVAREMDAGQLAEIPVLGLDLGRSLRAVWPGGTRPTDPAMRLVRYAMSRKAVPVRPLLPA